MTMRFHIEAERRVREALARAPTIIDRRSARDAWGFSAGGFGLRDWPALAKLDLDDPYSRRIRFLAKRYGENSDMFDMLERWREKHGRNVKPPSWMFGMEARHMLVRRYAWAIPNAEVIKRFAKLSPIVEFGAGTGYWSWLLTLAGADVVAIDRAPPPVHMKENGWHFVAHDEDDGVRRHARARRTFVDVKRGDAEVLREHRDRTLLLCWAPFDNDMAVHALAAWRGSRLAFVGESSGGCNATPEFFDALDGLGFKEGRPIVIPSWPGIRDYARIYTR